jgi:hypothetical protein
MVLCTTSFLSLQHYVQRLLVALPLQISFFSSGLWLSGE